MCPVPKLGLLLGFYYCKRCSNTFILLLVMNSAIIYTLHKRSMDQGQLQGRTQGQDKNDVQKTRMKLYERQVYVMLLFVTFSFLILTMPFYVWTFLRNFYKNHSPCYHAVLRLLQAVVTAAKYSNYGINFFLYAISGQKFRTDLVKLFSLLHNNTTK